MSREMERGEKEMKAEGIDSQTDITLNTMCIGVNTMMIELSVCFQKSDANLL